MRKASTELSQSRGLKRRPLLRTSSPLNPKNQPRTYIRIGTANGGTSLPSRVGNRPFRSEDLFHKVRQCNVAQSIASDFGFILCLKRVNTIGSNVLQRGASSPK